jgi:hypothetical protein
MNRITIKTLSTTLFLLCALQAKSVYYIGNSHTDEAIGVMSIMTGFGDTSTVVGRTMTPGSPLWLLYREREQKNGLIWYNGTVDWSSQNQTLPQILSHHEWDVVVLQVFPKNGDNLDKTSPAALGFAQMVYESNPDCQIAIMTSHAYAYSDDAYWATHMGYVTSLYEPLAQLISDTYSDKKPVKVIPILQVMNQVRNAITSGGNPVLGDFNSYYQQGGTDAHLEPKGLYLHALTNYATLFEKDPHNAVISAIHYWQYPDGYSVNTAYASEAWDIVWDYVSTYPWAGVATTVSVKPQHYTPQGTQTKHHRNALTTNLRGQRLSLQKLHTAAVLTVRKNEIDLLVPQILRNDSQP